MVQAEYAKRGIKFYLSHKVTAVQMCIRDRYYTWNPRYRNSWKIPGRNVSGDRNGPSFFMPHSKENQKNETGFV